MNILVILALVVAGILFFLPVIMAWSHYAGENKQAVNEAKSLRLKKAVHPAHA